MEIVRDLRNEGYNVVLVSSGAVGVGCQRLGLVNRPSELAKKQALAAVGQVHLMRYYDDLFSAVGLKCSQVLLTLDNLANRGQYSNAVNTFAELLTYQVIPVVNENDTVAVEQLKIGDNDTLSAHVAAMVHAKWLFLLTDVDALYTANPSTDPSATPIREVPDLWSLQVDTSTKGTQWGTGGMATKLTAARIATASGCNMAICHFADPKNIISILNGERVGTVFHASTEPVQDRKRWILSVPLRGELWVDENTVLAVRDRKSSLFSVGIVRVDGDFAPQDAIRICDDNGREFARGLVNYAFEDVQAAQGMTSKVFLKRLGSRSGQEEIVHKGNLCLLVNPQTHDDDDEDDDDEDDDDDHHHHIEVDAHQDGGAGTDGAEASKATLEGVTERLRVLMERQDK